MAGGAETETAAVDAEEDGVSAIAEGAAPMLERNPYMGEIEHPRLDWHMDNWALYVRSGGTRHLRCKTQSMWVSGSRDFDSMAASMDNRCALAVDAIVWEELTIPERCSVLNIHLGQVWRLKRLNIQVVYVDARLKLSAGLVKRHIP